MKQSKLKKSFTIVIKTTLPATTNKIKRFRIKQNKGFFASLPMFWFESFIVDSNNDYLNQQITTFSGKKQTADLVVSAF